MEKIIEEYMRNRDERIRLSGQMDVEKGRIMGEINRINDDFEGIISKLTNNQEKQVTEKERSLEKIKTEIDSELEMLSLPIRETELKLKFLELKKEIKNKPEVDERKIVTPRRYGDKLKITKLGDLIKDEFIHIKLYIVENDKPKNKFSLCAIGICAFSKFMNVPDSYGVPLRDFYAHNLNAAIKDLPTVEELKKYAEKNRKNILGTFLLQYHGIKEKYLDTIQTYSLKDFKPLSEVVEVTKEEAPLICTIKEYRKKVEWRLYQDFYFHGVKKIEKNKNAWTYIKVDGKLFQRYCRKELMSITQTGNMAFGDWWSLSIEQDHANKSNTYFNEENWARILEEATQHVKKRGGKRISFSPPKVEWVKPDLIMYQGKK